MAYRLLLLVTGAAAAHVAVVWQYDFRPTKFVLDVADTIKWTGWYEDSLSHDVWLLKDSDAYVSTPRRANRPPTRSPLAG